MDRSCILRGRLPAPGHAARSGGNSIHFCDRSSLRARQLKRQTDPPLLHRPVVIRFEDRPQQERQPSDQRLRSLDLPVECNVSVIAVLRQRPGARSLEIARRPNRQPFWPDRFDLLRVPTQFVRKPAPRHHPNPAPPEFAHRQVDRRPPSGIIQRFGEYRENLFRRGAKAPSRDEVIPVAHA